MHASKSQGLYFEDNNQNDRLMSVEEITKHFKLNAKNHKPDLVILPACNSIKYAEAIRPYCKNVIGAIDFLPDEIAAMYAKKIY